MRRSEEAVHTEITRGGERGYRPPFCRSTRWRQISPIFSTAWRAL